MTFSFDSFLQLSLKNGLLFFNGQLLWCLGAFHLRHFGTFGDGFLANFSLLLGDVAGEPGILDVVRPFYPF